VVASLWSVLALGVPAGIAVLLFLHRGDAEGSARLANAEVEQLLERDERVLHRVGVLQRHWWDSFRVTHGVLVATDRRLLLVGVPPEPLLPRSAEPLDISETTFSFERTVVAGRSREFLGTSPGVQLTDERGLTRFAHTARDRARVDSVLAVLTRRQAALRLAQEAERRAAEVAAAASRRAIYHLVQRGEALDFIARRYGVPTDSIIRWNNLPTTRITAGRRLLVKPESQ